MNKKIAAMASCLAVLLVLVGYTDSKKEFQQAPNNTDNPRHVAESSDSHNIDDEKIIASGSDGIIKKLFDNKQSGVQVQGSGIVTHVLPDDNEGIRHQRLILTLNSGQTLLIAHNIDIAPRLEGISLGAKVEFYGEYFYNDQGGGIHWTHHDPNGKHESGYLRIQSLPSSTPRPMATPRNYIGNKNSLVLHVPTCDSLPYEHNRVFFGTIDEALNQGYRKHYECMGR
jgi:hypothetical protein